MNDQAVRLPDTKTPVQAVPLSQGTVVEQSRAIAEVAAAVQVAQQFPRDEQAAVSQMIDLCSRLPIAQRAFYEVPNRGSGMSVHIARELARIWGNNDHGVRELRRDDEQGVSEMTVWAWDQEKNTRATRSFIAPHIRMVGGQRKALTDTHDIYLANMNIGARAVREAIFDMLPGWFVAEAEERLQHTLRTGGGEPIEDRRAAAVDKFDGIDIAERQLAARIGRPADQWTPKDLATLARIYTAITIDGIRASEFFPEVAVTVPPTQPTRTPAETANVVDPPDGTAAEVPQAEDDDVKARAEAAFADMKPAADS